MKTLLAASLVLAGLGFTASASAATVDLPGIPDASYVIGPGLGLAIPDDDPLGLATTISVPDSFAINKVALVIQLDHTWVGDLIFTLTGPDGTTVTLADRPGSDFPDDFGDSSNLSATRAIVFGDLGPFVAENMGAGACTGTDSVIGVDCGRWFTPEEALTAAFLGSNGLGDWTLTVSDNAGQDTGVLDGWLIAFNFQTAVPVPPAVWLFASGLFALVARRRR
jgi:subtilisin-like proprotein convertase family protein